MIESTRQPCTGWLIDSLRHKPKRTATRQSILAESPYSEAALDASAVFLESLGILDFGSAPGDVCTECGHRKRSSRTWRLTHVRSAPGLRTFGAS